MSTVHLYLLDEAGVDRARLEDRLGRGERARWAAMRDASARRRFAAGRALCRHALGAQTGDRDWRFVAGPNGRPELAPNPHGLTFNLAHTDGLIACVVARGVRCGVDVECTPTRARTVALAGPRLAPPERSALALAPPERRGEAFGDCWVLKEAYLKALGAGLEVLLDSFWLERRGDGTAALHHPAAGAAEAALWRFTLVRHSAHAVAVAVRDPRCLAVTTRGVSAGALLAPSHPAVPITHPGGTPQ